MKTKIINLRENNNPDVLELLAFINDMMLSTDLLPNTVLEKTFNGITITIHSGTLTIHINEDKLTKLGITLQDLGFLAPFSAKIKNVIFKLENNPQ